MDIANPKKDPKSSEVIKKRSRKGSEGSGNNSRSHSDSGVSCASGSKGVQKGSSPAGSHSSKKRIADFDDTTTNKKQMVEHMSGISSTILLEKITDIQSTTCKAGTVTSSTPNPSPQKHKSSQIINKNRKQCKDEPTLFSTTTHKKLGKNRMENNLDVATNEIEKQKFTKRRNTEQQAAKKSHHTKEKIQEAVTEKKQAGKGNKKSDKILENSLLDVSVEADIGAKCVDYIVSKKELQTSDTLMKEELYKMASEDGKFSKKHKKSLEFGAQNNKNLTEVVVVTNGSKTKENSGKKRATHDSKTKENLGKKLATHGSKTKENSGRKVATHDSKTKENPEKKLATHGSKTEENSGRKVATHDSKTKENLGKKLATHGSRTKENSGRKGATHDSKTKESPRKKIATHGSKTKKNPAKEDDTVKQLLDCVKHTTAAETVKSCVAATALLKNKVLIPTGSVSKAKSNKIQKSQNFDGKKENVANVTNIVIEQSKECLPEPQKTSISTNVSGGTGSELPNWKVGDEFAKIRSAFVKMYDEKATKSQLSKTDFHSTPELTPVNDRAFPKWHRKRVLSSSSSSSESCDHLSSYSCNSSSSSNVSGSVVINHTADATNLVVHRDSFVDDSKNNFDYELVAEEAGQNGDVAKDCDTVDAYSAERAADNDQDYSTFHGIADDDDDMSVAESYTDEHNLDNNVTSATTPSPSQCTVASHNIPNEIFNIKITCSASGNNYETVAYTNTNQTEAVDVNSYSMDSWDLEDQYSRFQRHWNEQFDCSDLIKILSHDGIYANALLSPSNLQVLIRAPSVSDIASIKSDSCHSGPSCEPGRNDLREAVKAKLLQVPPCPSSPVSQTSSRNSRELSASIKTGSLSGTTFELGGINLNRTITIKPSQPPPCPSPPVSKTSSKNNRECTAIIKSGSCHSGATGEIGGNNLRRAIKPMLPQPLPRPSPPLSETSSKNNRERTASIKSGSCHSGMTGELGGINLKRTITVKPSQPPPCPSPPVSKTSSKNNRECTAIIKSGSCHSGATGEIGGNNLRRAIKPMLPQPVPCPSPPVSETSSKNNQECTASIKSGSRHSGVTRELGGNYLKRTIKPKLPLPCPYPPVSETSSKNNQECTASIKSGSCHSGVTRELGGNYLKRIITPMLPQPPPCPSPPVSETSSKNSCELSVSIKSGSCHSGVTGELGGNDLRTSIKANNFKLPMPPLYLSSQASTTSSTNSKKLAALPLTMRPPSRVPQKRSCDGTSRRASSTGGSSVQSYSLGQTIFQPPSPIIPRFVNSTGQEAVKKHLGRNQKEVDVQDDVMSIFAYTNSIFPNDNKEDFSDDEAEVQNVVQSEEGQNESSPLLPNPVSESPTEKLVQIEKWVQSSTNIPGPPLVATEDDDSTNYNSNKRFFPIGRALFMVFQKRICHNHFIKHNCWKHHPLMHRIPPDTEQIITKLNKHLFDSLYFGSKHTYLFSKLFPYFVKRLEKERKPLVLTSLIGDVLGGDICDKQLLIECVIKSLEVIGTTFIDAVNGILFMYGSENICLSDILLCIIVQRKHLHEDWELIAKLVTHHTEDLDHGVVTDLIRDSCMESFTESEEEIEIKLLLCTNICNYIILPKKVKLHSIDTAVMREFIHFFIRHDQQALARKLVLRCSMDLSSLKAQDVESSMESPKSDTGSAITTVSQEGQENDQLLQEGSSNTPLLQESCANTPLQQENCANTPLQPESRANTTLHVPEDRVHIPFVPEVQTHTPLLSEIRTHTPLLPEVRTQTPLLPEVQTHTPFMAEVRTQTPLLVEVRTQTPHLTQVQTHTPMLPEVHAHSPFVPEGRANSPLTNKVDNVDLKKLFTAFREGDVSTLATLICKYKSEKVAESFTMHMICIIKEDMVLQGYNVFSKCLEYFENVWEHTNDEVLKKMLQLLAVNLVCLLEQNALKKEAYNILIKFEHEFDVLCKAEWFVCLNYSNIAKYFFFCKILIHSNLEAAERLLFNEDLKLLHGSNFWQLERHRDFHENLKVSVVTSFIGKAMNENLPLAQKIIVYIISDKSRHSKIDISRIFNRLLIKMLGKSNEYSDELSNMLQPILDDWYNYLEKDVFRSLILALCNKVPTSKLQQLYLAGCKMGFYKELKGTEAVIQLTTDMVTPEIFFILWTFFDNLVHHKYPRKDVKVYLHLPHTNNHGIPPAFAIEDMQLRIREVLTNFYPFCVSHEWKSIESCIVIPKVALDKYVEMVACVVPSENTSW